MISIIISANNNIGTHSVSNNTKQMTVYERTYNMTEINSWTPPMPSNYYKNLRMHAICLIILHMKLVMINVTTDVLSIIKDII